MQVEWKWCNELSSDNLKHKLYTAHNFWEEAPLPSLYYIVCLSMGTTSKCHFSSGSQVGVPKLGLLLSQNFGHSYLSQIKSFFSVRGQYFIALENIFPTMYNTFQLDLIWFLLSRGLLSKVKLSIWNFTPGPSFDHNSWKSGLNEQCKGTLIIYASKPF